MRLVLLDMAGTTIDERGDVYRALADAVAELGWRPSDPNVQDWMGMDKREAIAGLTGLGGLAPSDADLDGAFADFERRLDAFYTQRPPVPLPGVEAAIETLRGTGVKVGLTTGFSRDVADRILGRIGWEVGADLDVVVTSDEVPAGRPEPHMIVRGMELAGVADPADVLAAGDTVSDLGAARAAGVLAVGVLTGKLTRDQLEQHPHDHILDGVADLPALLGC